LDDIIEKEQQVIARAAQKERELKAAKDEKKLTSSRLAVPMNGGDESAGLSDIIH